MSKRKENNTKAILNLAIIKKMTIRFINLRVSMETWMKETYQNVNSVKLNMKVFMSQQFSVRETFRHISNQLIMIYAKCCGNDKVI